MNFFLKKNLLFMLLWMSLSSFYPCIRYAMAQELLPQGAGALLFQYRKYFQPEVQYDSERKELTLGDLYHIDINGQAMLKGDYGARPQELATELAKFDKSNSTNLVERLNIGRFIPEVKADANIYAFGLALGIKKWLTIYAGIPIAQVTVQGNYKLTGRNTSLELKNELGELAYDEIKQGLSEASKININDVIAGIKDLGYNPRTPWNHTAQGDFMGGLMLSPLDLFGLTHRVGHKGVLTVEVNLPTSYHDQPGMLLDPEFGKGYPSLSTRYEAKLTTLLPFYLYGGYYYDFNFSAKVEKWASDTSTTAGKSARKIMDLSPGNNFTGLGGMGIDFHGLNPAITLSYEHHAIDSYKDSNGKAYNILEKNTETEQLSLNSSFTFNTVAFSPTFIPPFMAQFQWKYPISGKNKMREHYIALSLTSFFPTPWYKEDAHLTTIKSKATKNQNPSTKTPKSSRPLLHPSLDSSPSESPELPKL